MAYIDDITITATHTSTGDAMKYIQPCLQFCLDKTKQSHTKSRQTTCTLFTPGPAECTSNLDLKIHNNALLMTMHPKVLGFIFQPQLTHIHNISIHTHKPIQIITSLTATGCGKQKETLIATYKAVMRPALEYASSIWSNFT